MEVPICAICLKSMRWDTSLRRWQHVMADFSHRATATAAETGGEQENVQE